MLPVHAFAVPNMGKPGVLIYNLMSSNQAEVRFKVKCLTKTSSYQLAVFTSNTRVAIIQGDSSYNVSCANATKSPEPILSGVLDNGTIPQYMLKGINDAKSDISKGSTNLNNSSDYIGHVTGLFNVTLEAKNIGRSFFVIIAKRLSGPENVIAKTDGNATGQSKGNGAGPPSPSGPQHQLHEDQVGLSMVIVMQFPRTIDQVFQIIIRCVIVMATAGMGLKVDLMVVKQVLKKPIGPVIGFCCQFICMPLIAYVVAKNVPQESAAVALGIFTCGVVPGGGVSNMFCFLLDADVSLSVTMTTISNIAALGMTPLWIFTLGSTFEDDLVALKVPYLKILETLAYVIVPLFVGIFVQIKFPKLEKMILKVLKPVIFVVVTCTIALGIYTNIHIFRMISPMAILAGCLLPYCGYLVGALISLLTCQTWTHIKTIAIETGIQNTGIAFMMLYLSLPPPDNQLATVGPAASSIMTPQPLFITVIIHLIYKRCTRQNKQQGDEPDRSTAKAEEGVTDDLVPSKKTQNSRESGRSWMSVMSSGHGKSAIVIIWERLAGETRPNLAEEMLHQELIVPSPTSPTGDTDKPWGPTSWSDRDNGTRDTNETL
ncbi:hypothetical protein EGW08_005209 [Elysia chlorotica]|uniref:Ileal sodium/bile acid cotransporter n=1 Tax=Elysia chlorotica TaxID=188477 RepID=A0A3S1AAW0_ELYCH|nr:hypothetical protein EGW08_005209 [Elysia chlorotica]